MLKRSTRCIERARELGALGRYLLGQLPKGVGPDFLDLELSEQARVMLGGSGSRYTFMKRLALTMLACDVPIQVVAKDQDVIRLAQVAIPHLAPVTPEPLYLGKRTDGTSPYSQGVFALGVAKANVRFGDAYRDLCRYEPALADRYRQLSGYTASFNDAQATAALIYGRCLDTIMPDPMEYAIRVILSAPESKTLNVAIKGAGLNGTRAGSMLCEALSLQGRGVGLLDMDAKIAERIGVPGSAGKLPNIDAEALRPHIRRILETELGRGKVDFDDTETFWSKRWLWAVNGGHSRIRETYEPKYRIETRGRMHRRAALEHWVDDPIPDWNGRVYVATSEKYEHGKTRYIMACDTVSYVAFEHLLKPIERAWKNRRVLLDPGRYGHYGMAKRVLELGEKAGKVWVMLDYDDFNAQHTLAAQRVVIEEVVRYTGYCPDKGKKLADSFDNMWVSHNDKLAGRITATLMSGHRGTTFLNSILNAAYIRLGIGADWDHMQSLHTGDDVVMAVPTFSAAASLVKRVLSTGVRMNPMKQSIGSVTAEFLRMAITHKGVRGYLPRTIASAVSGSWTTSDPLSSDNVVRSFAQGGRTLINRSGCRNAPLLFMTAMRRRSGLGTSACRQVLLGSMAVDEGPCFSDSLRFQAVKVLPSKGVDTEAVDLSGHPAHATEQYLVQHTTPVEQAALLMTKASIVNPMLLASYSKTLALDNMPESERVRFRRTPKVAARGSISPDLIAGKPAELGVLQRYPLLSYLKKCFTNQQVIELLKLAGVDPGPDPLKTAWGAEARGVVIVGTMSYSDASSFCRKTTCGVVHSMYPVAM